MEILIKAAQFLLSLSILIILHELGHFLFARLFKTRVEKFYLFFDPWFSLFKLKKGETEYGIGWLPLGGYVKISGMIDESMDTEQLKQPAQPYEFRAKPPWQRLLIMLGGVLVNFVLALFIYSSIMFVWGEEYLPNKSVKYGIVVDSLAYEAGLRNGDKIVALDGNEIDDFHSIVPDILLNQVEVITVNRNESVFDLSLEENLRNKMLKNPEFITFRKPFIADDFTKQSVAKEAGIKVGDEIIGINDSITGYYDEFRNYLQQFKNESVDIIVKRDGEVIKIPLTVSEEGIIGVYASPLSEMFELKTIEYSFFAAIPAGINKGFETIKSYLKQLKLLVKPETKAYESLGGFIRIGSIFPGTWDWQIFWNMTALLSIILAIMNILPIPALDGGHVLFLLYEIVTGRKPGDKFLEYAQMAGMIILLTLLVYANGNDIYHFIIKK